MVGLEEKVKGSFLGRIRNFVNKKVVLYSLLGGLALWARYGCGDGTKPSSNMGIDADKPKDVIADGYDIPGIISGAVSHYIDVGQGDASYFENERGLRLLIDCGERPGLVKEYLWNHLGEQSLDALLITHTDGDHSNCLGILEEFKIGYIFTNGELEDCDTHLCQKLVNKLKKHELPGPCFEDMQEKNGQCQVLKDTTIHLDDTRIDFIAAYDTINKSLSDNDNSLMARIWHEDVRYFYPGDCERKCQEEVVKTPEMIESEISLVPHHCRLDERQMVPQFIEKIGTKVKIISTGWRCVRKYCLELIKQSGADYYLTNECDEIKNEMRYSQDIQVKTDGKRVEVKARPPEEPWGD